MQKIEEEETNNSQRGPHLDSDWWRDRRIIIGSFNRQNFKPHEFFLFTKLLKDDHDGSREYRGNTTCCDAAG